MIKWPEPAEYIWEPDGTFNIGQERGLSPNTGPCNGWRISPVHTEAQLKQAVRDFGEHLAKHFGSMPGREMFGGEIEDEIRALIKEIE